jgi:hypothetical protein
VCNGRFWSSPELGGFDLMWLIGWFQNVVLKQVGQNPAAEDYVDFRYDKRGVIKET